jgi:hypothetical protein
VRPLVSDDNRQKREQLAILSCDGPLRNSFPAIDLAARDCPRRRSAREALQLQSTLWPGRRVAAKLAIASLAETRIQYNA